MKRIITYTVLLVLLTDKLVAQVNFSGQVPHEKTYELRDVYDSTYGIQYFDKFCPAMGGDSSRKSVQGYAASGWIEDHYSNGALIHRGFYANGQLTIYTNYYPTGATEREYKLVTETKTELKKYFLNGTMKSDVIFVDGNSMTWHDYYDNGQASYIEEYDKKHERLLRRDSYFRDGKPSNTFEPITDKKPYRYAKNEYYPNGQMKESQQMLYSSDALDFVRDGEDKQYDESGKVIADDFYLQGTLDHSNK